ncbi:MAG: class I SAM-dependent methyltransferase [Nannocystaceae bacterium]
MNRQDIRLPAAAFDFANGTSADVGGGVDYDSILLASYLLEEQAALGIGGPVCEIGVKEGRFLVVLASYTGEGEHIVGVDPYYDLPDLKPVPQQNIEALAGAGERVVFHYEDSRRLTAAQLLPPGADGFRFIHIDGNHEEDFVHNDLELAATLIQPGGIVALDDYFHYSGIGVSSALFRFFSERPDTELAPLVTCGPKFYLCTRSHLDLYRARFLRRFDCDRRPILKTTWLGKPIISAHLTGRLAERIESLNMPRVLADQAAAAHPNARLSG